MAAAEARVQSKFGFIPDTSVSAFRNAVRLHHRTCNENNMHLSNLPIPSNLAFHDLTPTKCAPDTTKALWGLGSKFVRTPYYTTGDVSSGLDHLQRGCYLKVYFTILMAFSSLLEVLKGYCSKLCNFCCCSSACSSFS